MCLVNGGKVGAFLAGAEENRASFRFFWRAEKKFFPANSQLLRGEKKFRAGRCNRSRKTFCRRAQLVFETDENFLPYCSLKRVGKSFFWL